MGKDLERRSEKAIPYLEIAERRKNEFDIDTADRQIDALFEELIETSIEHKQRDGSNPQDTIRAVSSKELGNIKSHDQGKYIEISANNKIQNTGSVFYARYQPGTRRIVMVRNN